MRVNCPKCGSTQAGYVVEGEELFVKCQCGYWNCVYSRRGGATITHSQEFDTKALPRKTSRVYQYYLALLDSWPQSITTGKLADAVKGGTIKTAGNCMTMLAHRGIATRVTDHSTKRGGNSWVVSDRLAKHLKLKR